MQLLKRLELLAQLQAYMLSDDAEWQAAKEKAYMHNGWFIPQFTDLAARNIASYLLSRTHLEQLVNKHNIPGQPPQIKTVGVVMPGNIPMAVFYDFFCVCLSGHRQRIKAWPADEVLIKHLVRQLAGWDAE